jgi:uncharacterized protein YidB (DUF937 family)
MGLLDSIAGQVGAAFSQNQTPGEQGGLMDMVTQLINNPETGGLQGLIQNFQEKGLGNAVASWVSTGPNQPVSSDQIQQALGNETVQNLAQKFGLSSDKINAGLASLLPQVIDKLTPDGQVPDSTHWVEQGLALLKGKLLG